MTVLVHKARTFAVAAHGDQKYGDKPYSYHLDATVRNLREAGFKDEEDLLAAGYLHDVEEDTKKTRDDVRDGFGEVIEGLVWACTGVGINRKERSASTVAKILLNPRALIVKLADKKANGQECLAGNPNLLTMYRREWPTFQEKLSHLLVPETVDPRILVLWRDLDRILRQPI